ncbi:uncharacterized protein BT62DRAFT_506784 [Guyanagaster necrorhizus]|uniref:Uncharacterized protein n=1 Tax=Guyanagaster necrorhizus TaxID=856835 RepID=A0A9P7W1K0_9AGAR|nr:uncharacterized protein BT62DRAFT_506784 [Guyanagaster necrorhizus MCA 3950]KAG7450345.1 hypothetical protein BT62DRAFT_506784 [Guyanagaster necrorhizus MCA 3950]
MTAPTTDLSLTDTEPPTDSETTPVDGLAVSLQGPKLQDEDMPTEQEDASTPQPSQRPLRIYTRSQILTLHKSPLVAPPTNMPELKDWFGAENEQNLNKKDHDSTPPNSARERRFRREVDDNEASSRSSFRSTLSQPSQMGNFKHQSLRDRDGDKDRDLRDKEGQERLRNLSDKFDRDRLALPLSNIRGKDKEAVSHLGPGSSRTPGQPQLSSVAARRSEARENGKKKAGETNEDWRRGGEPRRLGRDERSDTRGDRDERDRPRSRVRDSSRSRRDPSTSKRDREDRDRRDRDREDHRRDGDRDDYRRGRDRDTDRDSDDPRRWRDDGRRDERMAMRRERDRDRERDRRDKPGHDQAWDSSNDRRWMPGDDRSKKTTGRDRKTGIEDGKDRDDRRGEREKEKEPAWMDTYIPASSSTGILGGKSADGELDGIQAWKKGMKEKEQRESKAEKPSEDLKDATDQTSPPEKQLDEIQIFKMLMKREQEQKKSDQSSDDSPELQSQDKGAAEAPSSESPTGVTTGRGAGDANAPPSLNTASTIQATPNVTVDPSVSVLSMFVSGEQSKQTSTLPDRERPKTPTSSRLFPRPINQDGTQADRSSVDPLQPQPTTVFNPPQGSRLLAFGSRAPAKPQTSTSLLANGAGTLQSQTKSSLVQLNLPPNVLPLESSKLESHRMPNTFSPFEEHDHSLSSSAAESARRERQSMSSESGPWGDLSAEGSALGQASGKGSRFAKFFDGKTREGFAYAPKAQTPVGFMSSSPTPGQRPEGGYSGNPDLRNMDDIYAMLNNSSQAQRSNNMNPPNSAPTIGGIPFGQHAQAQLHLLQQQQMQSQSHHLQNSRLEPLYESRLDNRNFMPDGLVPGLRSAPPPRNRENGGMFSDPLDEAIHLNAQRIPPMPQRGIDHLYSGPVPYSQQAGRHAALPLQQYRGGPSPISSQNPLASQHQRIPPGLANLGGRPPHEPNQFVGVPSIHGGPVNGPQPFTTFGPGGNLGYVGPPRAPQQLQSTVSQHPLGGLGHPNGLDLRNANQSQLLNMGTLGGSVRGMGANVYPGQNHSAQASLHAMRQPQQQLPPHLAPHMLPHLQQQVPPNAQSADLMALLLGGQRRE